MVVIIITNKPKCLGITVRLFKSNPSMLKIPIKSESGNIMVENIVNILIVSFNCRAILEEKISHVAFIVYLYDSTISIN